MARLCLLLTCVFAITAACGPTNDSDNPVPSLAAGKADVATRAVIGPEWMVIGGKVAENTFSADLQFYGYKFRAIAGARITAEVKRTTGTGSLNSTLSLYAGVGPSSPELAFDDESGYAKLSRIKDKALPDDGTYLLVVGTVYGRGRGNFKLELMCTNEACLPAEQDVDCDLFDGVVSECVHEDVANTEFDCYDDPCPSQSDIDNIFDRCIADDYVETLRDSVCGWHDPPTPSWCTKPFAEFFATDWPICKPQMTCPTPEDFVWDPY